MYATYMLVKEDSQAGSRSAFRTHVQFRLWAYDPSTLNAVCAWGVEHRVVDRKLAISQGTSQENRCTCKQHSTSPVPCTSYQQGHDTATAVTLSSPKEILTRNSTGTPSPPWKKVVLQLDPTADHRNPTAQHKIH